MMIFRILVLVCIAITAQGAEIGSAHAGDDANSQELRRAELRAALKARKSLGSIGQVSELVAVKPPLKRQLSDLERADLRQQLRQQLRSGRSDHP